VLRKVEDAVDELQATKAFKTFQATTNSEVHPMLMILFLFL